MIPRRIVVLLISIFIVGTLTSCQNSQPEKEPSVTLVATPQSVPASPTPPLSTESPETTIPLPASLVGQPLKGSRLAVYRLMENGQLRHIQDWSTYLAFGYETNDIITVSDEALTTYPLGLPLTSWLTSEADPTIYFVSGKRYQADLEKLEMMGADILDVSLVPAEFIEQFPLAPPPSDVGTIDEDSLRQLLARQITAATWHNGFLWLAEHSGRLVRWDIGAGQHQVYQLPGTPIIRSLTSSGSTLYAGTEGGGIWQLTPDGTSSQLVEGTSNWVSALALGPNNTLWYADLNHYDRTALRYQLGRGIVQLKEGQERQTLTLFDALDAEHDPLRSVSAIAFDPQSNILWASTRFAGLVSYNTQTKTWQHQHMLNSHLAADIVNDLELAPDGTLWLATASSVSRYVDGEWANYGLAEGVTDKGALSLAIATDNTIWVGGDRYLAWLKPGVKWEVRTVIEQPLLADQFHFVVLDEANQPWFPGGQQKIHFDGQEWWSYDSALRPLTQLKFMQPPPGIDPPPVDFPNPNKNYTAWLQTWPRPERDNGRGLHFVQDLWIEADRAQEQIERLKQLGVRWTVVNYANHYQLKRLAPLFAEAGIMVVWRPFVRPYQSYQDWPADVEFLRAWGLPPYLQLYNEPGLAQEWEEGNEPQPVDQEIYLNHLLPAIRQVYDAGGYVGLQFIDPTWLQLTLQTMKAKGMADTFDRLFFIPHPYGLNHPPDYDEDLNSVLGFREFAQVFEAEIGFVPMMVAGEGGWRPGEAQDTRYPPISEATHRDYHLAVFEWFRTGQLSNGEPLPDYLFAFCPWLIADPYDPAAWFDSESGDRMLTIEAVEAVPPFERKFSWDN